MHRTSCKVSWSGIATISILIDTHSLPFPLDILEPSHRSIPYESGQNYLKIAHSDGNTDP